MENEVSIIRAKTSLEDRRMRGKEIVRKRVAAYCRVSTDGEEQLNSFSSQVKYYTELIEKEPDWMMAGVYADEAITGTQVSKREGFQKMIKACLDGEVDMVITKSISRFARNTLDTLKYVRTLKEKNIAVFFEDEKINTLSMDGELLLVVLSSVAQQEVENISNNVKKGLAMKMSRGEIVGFVGALGYDYDPATKTMTVNREEAKIVQYIFNRWHGGKYRKTIWLCITASKKGKKNCPNCKAIPEEALMSAFVESYNIMTRDHKDVLDEFLSRVESTLSDSDVSKRIEKEKDKLKDISYKLNNLLDMHLEGKIDFETFEKKRDTLQNQLSEKKIEIEALEDIGNSKLDLEDRIAFMREKLETETTIKEFDRQVFESIVDYVIVGGYNEEGNADPSMITFVYRTGFKDRKDANHFKPERLNAAKKKTGSDSHTKEVCQSDDTSSNSSLSHSGLQSLIPDDSNILQSNTSPDARRDGCLAFQGRVRQQKNPCGVQSGGYGHIGIPKGCDL